MCKTMVLSCQEIGVFPHRWDIYGPDSVWNITGPIPDLAQRSFLGAWWDNYWTANALNISANSTLSLGDKSGNDFVNYTSFINPLAIAVSNIDGAFSTRPLRTMGGNS
jgi:hypothetical protein